MSAEDRFYRSVVDALTHDRLTLPTLPEVALRIGEMSRREDVSVNLLAGEIAKDPAMAVRLLRVANSAYAAGDRRIDNLSQAVTRLGLQMTRLLVTGLAVEHLFVSKSPWVQLRLRQTWARSTEVAALAQVLARHCTVLQPEIAMLAGLVHQIGVLPVLKLAEAQPELSESPAALDATLKRLSARVGRLVLQAWNFPESLVDVPYYQEDIYRTHSGAPDYLDVVIVAVLQLHGAHDQALSRLDRHAVSAFTRIDLSPDLAVLDLADYLAEYDANRSGLAA
ncbi:HDOD domain-containing protein [Solimonas sp. K1W22B-7]|uniref:HDOD domain-containing protein n=1 Tax=Solimonas sp. K1W22B-7 TaxID=2303331 RepID=UPI000E32ED55|nr:HDOD domain-containing protein [Solimonas sp. K1W22B-7]AXQ28874.1 HDOD domain-containing protein [Solimonas sp. K1W22B-7]